MFETHKLNGVGVVEMNVFKTKMSLAVTEAMQSMLEGRNKNIFKTKIEEAVFFGAKAIAENSPNYDMVMDYPEFER